MGDSNIKEVFKGSRVLITGGFGFLGQVLLEKLLRACEPEKVYLFARPKKGKTEAERFDKIFSDQLFGRLVENYPDARNKVSLISGDLDHQDLGLSPEDRAILTRDVDFVFHSAATVRFDEKLKKANRINVRGTKKLLELAKTMKNLKAFVHISTAYSFCPIKTIDEKIYPVPWNWKELDQLVESLDDTTLDWITPIITGDWPNTYSFTKAVAENLVQELAEDLPVAIVRPSIVNGTAKEPVIMWTNNLYGTVGVTLGAAIGIFNVQLCDVNNNCDMVPVDMVINTTLAVAWDLSQSERKAIKGNDDNKIAKSIPIYNSVSSQQNPITWEQNTTLSRGANPPPSMHIVFYHSFTMTKYKIVRNAYAIVLHYLRALVIDTVLKLAGKKPMLWNAQMKISKYMSAANYFAMQGWTFTDFRTQELWKKLSPRDQQLFWFNMAELDWSMYLYYLLRGVRLYFLRESYDTVPEAKKKFYRLKILHYASAYSFYTAVAYCAYKVLHSYTLACLQRFEVQ